MHRPTLFFTIPLTLLLLSGIADACAIGPKPTVLEAYNNADVLVIARAIAIEKVDPKEPTPPNASRVLSTTMEIQKVFKGNLKVGDKIIFGQGNGIRCTEVFYEDVVGDEYLFYLERPPKGETLWYEFNYSRSDITSRAADDLLYLNNIAGVRGRTRVSGTLALDDDDGGLAGKKIWIQGNGKVYETTTDKNGVYEFYDLPAGTYVLEPGMPFGWKIDHQTRGTTTVSDKTQISHRQIRFNLKPRQHAAIDISFVLDNVVSGIVVDSHGNALPEVQVSLKSIDSGNESLNFEYTDERGRFAVESIEPGNYILIVNEDGKRTIQQPLSALYYPNFTEQARARVFRIRAGDSIKGLKIVVPNIAEMVMVQRVVRYADGKPAPGTTVRFRPTESTDVDGSALVDTDEQGRFSFKIFKGLPGELHADFYAHTGSTAQVLRQYDYDKCPYVQKIMKETGTSMVKTPALKIDPQDDLHNVVLTFAFPRCR